MENKKVNVDGVVLFVVRGGKLYPTLIPAKVARFWSDKVMAVSKMFGMKVIDVPIMSLDRVNEILKKQEKIEGKKDGKD
ncbi:hypothetical protein [Clostridium sp.]|uniref:hypothetical protein n=1 Tax=Clostridium sp. TaxID=1506 RepID=UPI001A6069B6|nr:hypothetical protein [Clostridium sp.]MBK5234079.1 hypothetical protein [Clostridium sp.]